MPDAPDSRPVPIRGASLLARIAGSLAVAGLLGVTLVGCGLVRPSQSPVIDGWRVGPVLDCGPDDRCPELLGAVRAAYDERYPGHPAIEGLALHREGVDVDPVTGDTILRTRSGGPVHVAVFELADGTVRALGVGFPGISREPVVVDQEPGLDP